MKEVKFVPLSLFLCISLLAFISCSKDNAVEPDAFTVTLTTSNLNHLEPGEGHYELWISFPDDDETIIGKTNARIFHDDENFISFGKFNLSEDNSRILSLDGQPMVFKPGIEEIDINLAIDAIITIELNGDQDNEPGSRIMGSVFTGTDEEATATLAAGNEDAFDFDYTTTNGSYILDTPTTSSTSDFNSGLWWVDPAGSLALSSGFTNLLALEDTSGWIYEGWVIDNSGSEPVLYSTGRFLSPNLTDNDLAGATAGPDGGGFPFPGQDFIQATNHVPALPQLDSGNYEVRITLEPELDNSTSPFHLVILSDAVIGPNVNDARSVQTMENRTSSSFPSATVRIMR